MFGNFAFIRILTLPLLIVMIKLIAFVVFASVVCLACSNNNPASSYAGFHADEAHTGIYQEKTFKDFDSLQWIFKSSGKIFSSPIIVNGVAYVGSEDSNLYAINTSDGTLKWKLHTNGGVSSSPAVYKDVVYCCSYDGYCYAADATNGKLIWKFKTGGEKKVGAYGLWTMKPADMYMEDLFDFFLSSPIVDVNNNDATVYFGSSDGNLYALNAATGSLKWKFKTDGIIHTSPGIYNGIVYVGSWDTYVYAIDAQTRKEKWKFKTQDQPMYHLLEGIQASPAVYDSAVYIGARDGYFYALNANNGALLWKYSADNSWIVTTAAIQNGTVYFGTSDSYLFLALDAKTGKEKYRMKANGYVYSSPAIAGSTAWFGDFSGKLYALDLNTDGKVWKEFYTPERKANAAILNPQGNIDFAYKAGKEDLSIYTTSVNVMNEFYKLGPIVSSPAISGNTIYFGSADSCLYAVHLKE
jgi:outer membrane protein assembly factor BamB